MLDAKATGKKRLPRFVLLGILMATLIPSAAWSLNSSCPQATVVTFVVPKGTSSLHVDWFGPVSVGRPSIVNSFIAFPTFTLVQYRYTWQGSAPWSLQLADARGNSLFSRSGVAVVHPCPCGGDPGVSGAEDIDISALTATGDLQVTETVDGCLGFSYETWNTSVTPPQPLFPAISGVAALADDVFVSFSPPVTAPTSAFSMTADAH